MREGAPRGRELLERHPEMEGLYVSTANSLPVLRAVRARKNGTRVRVITTDLFPELIPMIEAGEVMATLYQRPFSQGRVAIQTLLRFLVNKTPPTPVTRLAPHIVLRSNLPIFTGYVSDPASIPV